MIKLVPVHADILSSYTMSGGTGGPRSGLRPLHLTGKMGVCHPEVAPKLKELHDAVTAAGGDFRVTELHRDIAVQRAARAKYDNWVRAGKPKPGTSQFNSSTMKAAFVAQPGRSTHNAGRAIDIHVGMLNFPGVAKDKQLDRMWELAKPIGWTPVIRRPDEGASESWHFDFWGELLPTLSRLGYEQAALCGAILVGHGDLTNFDARVQAALVRAGFDIGKIDGQAGAKTRAGLSLALPGINAVDVLQRQDESVILSLLNLPVK